MVQDPDNEPKPGAEVENNAPSQQNDENAVVRSEPPERADRPMATQHNEGNCAAAAFLEQACDLIRSFQSLASEIQPSRQTGNGQSSGGKTRRSGPEIKEIEFSVGADDEISIRISGNHEAT